MKTLGLSPTPKTTQPDSVDVYTEECGKSGSPAEGSLHTMSRDHQFSVGDVVLDSHQESPNPAVVVNLPPKQANEWTAYTNTTIAEDNPDYPDESPSLSSPSTIPSLSTPRSCSGRNRRSH